MTQTLRDLPQVDPKQTDQIPEKQLVDYLHKSINTILVVSERLEDKSNKASIRAVLQKHLDKEYQALLSASKKGYAYMGLGVVYASIITGKNLNRLREYADSTQYQDSRGSDKLAMVFSFQNLVKGIQGFHTLQKADPNEVVGFAFSLPKVPKPFNPVFANALAVKSKLTGNSFATDLFALIYKQATQQTSNAFDDAVKIRAVNCLKSCADKGYPEAVIYYSQILTTQKEYQEAGAYRQSLLRNPYASSMVQKLAKRRHSLGIMLQAQKQKDPRY